MLTTLKLRRRLSRRAGDPDSATRESRRRIWSQRVLLWLAALFLLSEVLAGPLRLVLARNGASALVYLPKLLLIPALVLVPLARGKVPRSFIAVTGGALMYALVGAVQLPGGIAQAFFGLWILAPLLFGLLAGPVLLSERRELRKLVLVLFWVACAGVVVNALWQFPWVGFSYDLAGAAIDASRQWGTSGFNRLAGFSSASFSAASQVLMFGIFLTATLRSRLWRAVVWVVAGAVIVLTTSKGPAGAWLLVTLYLMTRRSGFRRSWDAVVLLLAAAVVLVPLSTLVVTYNPVFKDFVDQLLFASFGDRLASTWPDSFKLLHSGLQWLTGLGLGGIGAPQIYFDPTNFSPADNLFVYLCVDFGAVVALLLVAWVALSALGRRRHDRWPRLLTSPLLLAILAVAGTLNVVEGATFALFLGLSLAVAGTGEQRAGIWKPHTARALLRFRSVPDMTLSQMGAKDV